MTQQVRNNSSRINKLRNLNILDTEVEVEFESIAEIATYICNAPISMVTFLDEDRQWFKSTRGIGNLKEAPVKTSFCIHTINETDGKLIVKDALQDSRFTNNPFVVNEPNLKFYAGVSIETADKHRIGTVCVYDFKPRDLSLKQLECLELLAQYTNKLVELKSKNQLLKQQSKTLLTINNDLKQFAYAIAHDIKAPLRIMSTFSKFLIKEAKNKLNRKELDYLNYIEDGAKELGNYTQNLLSFSEKTQVDTSQSKLINIKDLIDDVDKLVNANNKISLLVDNKSSAIFVSEIGLKQILKNLIGNSIRYKKENITNPYVIISISEDENKYSFKVTDNGSGMTKEQLSGIFDLFNRNKESKESTGIGLNIVKRLVEKMNGTLVVDSTLDHGTEVSFTIAKVVKFL